ncbi:aryl-sulfate sulfohydrolase [bacterium]|nr:MAG: aryl-sulfate sulfohydrolase [bacterium]
MRPILLPVIGGAIALLSSLAPQCSAAQVAQPSAQKPNIVLIFADDLGWKDTGFTGSDFYETPNIDRLAKQGMVFSTAYASAANCAPSRACLMSGQYTPRHGVYAVGDTERGPKNQMRMVPIPNKGGLAPENVTVAEALKAGGYATGIFGKWHLSGRDGAPPAQQGFDTVFDAQGKGEGRGDKGPAEDPKYVFKMADEVGTFMEKNKQHPFFAYVAHDAVHAPLAARPESLAKFRAKAKGTHGNALYAANIYDFDASVGKLMQKISDLGLEKNTLVVFTSDNGAPKGVRSSQEPLRGNKGAYYEAGIREPMWAVWPGVIKAGTKCDVPVCNIDFYPTFLAATKTAVPADKVLDGESLLPLFQQQGTLKRDALFWHFPGYLNNPVSRPRDTIFRTRPVSVIRKGDWKLLLYHEEWQLDGGRAKVATNHAVELYNLADDVGERRDLANENVAKRDELLNDLLAWIEKTKAPLPSQPNPAYAPQDAPAGGEKDTTDHD